MVLIDPTSAAAKYHSEDKSYYSATVRKWSGNRYRLGILQPNGTDRLIALIDSYPFITPCGWRNSWDMRCKCYIVYLFCIAVYSACICKDDVDNMDWYLGQQDIHVGYEWYINDACISVKGLYMEMVDKPCWWSLWTKTNGIFELFSAYNIFTGMKSNVQSNVLKAVLEF